MVQLLAALIILVLAPSLAHAYVGPGRDSPPSAP